MTCEREGAQRAPPQGIGYWHWVEPPCTTGAPPAPALATCRHQPGTSTSLSAPKSEVHHGIRHRRGREPVFLWARISPCAIYILATIQFRFFGPSSFNTALQLVLRPHFLVHFLSDSTRVPAFVSPAQLRRVRCEPTKTHTTKVVRLCEK
jgi:hypothetical protein